MTRIFFQCLIVNFILTGAVIAQPYPPHVGQPGTTAIHKDSSVFINWATGCRVVRGFQDISDPQAGYASSGDSTFATGKAQVNGPVSLGDGGYAVCTFEYPIKNGTGPDFAVFENGFDDAFLELAFVEVSSDGSNFFRFPSHSLTDTLTQTSSFGPTDATKINNFAGKYRGGYGVPFDLEDVPVSTLLNKNAVTHVLVRDVIGSLNNNFVKRDSYGNKINDPWPTSFPQGGFDLDAIGIIHESLITGVEHTSLKSGIIIFPNPSESNYMVTIDSKSTIISVELFDFSGVLLSRTSENNLDITRVGTGIYILKIVTENEIAFKKLIVD